MMFKASQKKKKQGIEMSQEGQSTFLVSFDGVSPPNKDLKDALEKGDVAAKTDALKKLIMLQINGEPQNHMIMTVIKYCVPVEDHAIKKLLIYFWEAVDRTDASGKLLPEMILLCSFLRSDLQHPNEFIRGVTLRFLAKIAEKDILEPLVSTVVSNLTHRVSFVRRNAVIAIQSIYTKFPQLLPDAPDLIEKFVIEENDPSARRNAFNMLFACSQERAIRFLAVVRETQDITAQGDVFQLAIIHQIRQLIQANPADKAKYVSIIFSVLQSKSPAVLFECASTLLSLTTSPTALKHAAGTFIQLLTTHSDNNVRLIVLDRLSDMKNRFPEVLQESLMDILRGVQAGNVDIRKHIIELALTLATPKNVEVFIQFLKKELVRSQSDDVGDKTAQQEYRQQVVKAIHCTVRSFPSMGPAVATIMLDYICEPTPSAHDVILFIREVMQTHPELCSEILTRLVTLFQMISSPKVLRTVLWIFGVHSKSAEQISNVISQIKSSLEPFPLAPLAGPATPKEQDQAATTYATTTVREDGTYVMSIAMVDKKSEIERSDLTGLRAQLVGGDYFVAASLANTLSKLIVQLFKTNVAHTLKNTMQVDVSNILHELVRYGTSALAPPMDDDCHERIKLCLTVVQNPKNEFLMSIVPDSIEAYEESREKESKPKGEEEQTQMVYTMADQPLSFSQLSKGKQALLDFEAAVDDVQVALSNESLEADGDFIGKLHRVVQLSGFSDPVYAEATVTVHQFDILVEMLVVNQTADTLQNLTVELATIGDLKLCERPQAYILQPYGMQTIRANIKVSSTETGIIFGSIVYDAPGSERNCVILNEIHIDIMDYIKPAVCSASDFRAMWTEFEWENKVVVNTDITDMKQFI